MRLQRSGLDRDAYRIAPLPARTRTPVGMWLAASALAWLGAAALAMEVPRHGWTAGFGLACGVLSYGCMTLALVLSLRRPFLERWFGPLDRVYRAHRMLGVAAIAGLALHLLLRNDPDGSRILDLAADLAFRPLGVAGAAVLAISVVLALAVKLPYHRWRPVHLATALAFVVLTAHGAMAADALDPTPAFGAALAVFAACGVAAVATRLIDKARGGIQYEVVATHRGPREVEVVLFPAGARTIAPAAAGQFAFLTASPGGRRETHPFTLTSARGSRQLSFTIRALGDWTRDAQEGLRVGDRVRVDGPYGRFTPAGTANSVQSEVWIGAGAGVTPFLAALRSEAETARRENHGSTPDGRHVELVIAARDRDDVPCWEDLVDAARRVPWVDLSTVFSADGGRIDASTVDRIVSRSPRGAHWFLCGPQPLTSLVARRLRTSGVPAAAIHREIFDWRGPRVALPARVRSR